MPTAKSKTSVSRPPVPRNTSSKSKPNGSILNFFNKKADETLFVAGLDLISQVAENHDRVDSANEGADLPEPPSRYNETATPQKRRKTSVQSGLANDVAKVEEFGLRVDAQEPSRLARRTGPFLEESDSEQDLEDEGRAVRETSLKKSPALPKEPAAPHTPLETDARLEPALVTTPQRPPPPLKVEATSVDFQDFADLDDFDEDLFEEGDEFLERKYMEEQAQLEAMENGNPDNTTPATRENCRAADLPAASNAGQFVETCPICQIAFSGVSELDAAVHVNNCLDGKPSPLPVRIKREPTDDSARPEKSASADQYRMAKRPPKPGQASPFVLGEASSSGSAFNKLMSGHAEDAAWAEAAAEQNASRGKPAYQRTCPFYKILPGLFICVDAFRYGAVAGCNAYFLSHFHSDHYIGLTSTWTHGPIFCSKVTGNLVKQQLRVDPKFVVSLDFEQTVEVPGTRGVQVTMISANHCPGSSLFLFEKVVGKKMNGEPRLQRILHCGDFRACKMHVEHPLLMPEVRDAVTDKGKEQKIDVCYLDTTYLNPKYAFPSQKEVIKACADMCVCLSKDTPDENDGWEQMKRQRAGEGMTKFIRKESTSEIKLEPAEDDSAVNDMKVEPNPHASQQILSSIKEKKGRGRLLVVVGTYSIGKERICVGIAKALNSKIYAPPSKQRIVAALEDPELDALMTTDPREAQVHMTPLFEIRAETLDDYLRDFFPHFTRAVGFRPSGWNYRPPNTRFIESPSVQTVLYGDNWKSSYSMRDLVPQRGSASRASCFGVPYSEHSSFRELTMFCCALRIEKIIPTVNIGSQKGRERMKAWCERWMVERKKNGLFTEWE